MKQPKAPTLKVENTNEPEIDLVQGIMPGSKNEYFVALALDKLEIEYRFQVPIMGGRAIRGGQVIDFVVYNPTGTPVFIQGEYWHKRATENEDLLKQADAERIFGTPPVLLLGEETDSADKAYAVVKERLA